MQRLQNYQSDPLLLDAVNSVLNECGIDGVSSLEDQSNLDLVNAIKCIRDSARGILGKGFDFNTFIVTLQPDMDGFIRWPDNVYQIKATDGTRILNQAGYIVKPDEGFSPKFTMPLEVEGIFDLPFGSIPTPVFDYIVIRAAETMNDRWVSSDVVEAAINKHLQECWLTFRQWWIDEDNTSMMESPAVQAITGRT
ncbi:hypothetical protein [Chromobacterium haemolyticum]|uniref:hypothetical protein n=2 Tax=Chromobacteriaceae TaxID=1499392 RepID=UPI00405609CE